MINPAMRADVNDLGFIGGGGGLLGGLLGGGKKKEKKAAPPPPPPPLARPQGPSLFVGAALAGAGVLLLIMVMTRPR